LNAQRLRKFCETYFGEHGGYAQQYLFHYARTVLRKSGGSNVSSTPLRSARNDTRKDGRMGGSKSKRKIRARAGVRMGLPRRRKLSVPPG
jgi:hypothetical protein